MKQAVTAFSSVHHGRKMIELKHRRYQHGIYCRMGEQ